MRVNAENWTIQHLRQHLQFAVELEFWTIPFYMSAMYSIVDRSSSAYQLIQSVVHQEMLHLQLASNVANAFGLSPLFPTPRYIGQTIPHLDFSIDHPDPRLEFTPFSAQIGPLDEKRINAMCLIEFPEWGEGPTDLHDTISEYGSIGAFYDAVEYGARLQWLAIQGRVRQVDHFAAFYRNVPSLLVSEEGAMGLRQVVLLLAVIRAQGEGENRQQVLPPAFQNTADDGSAAMDHYEKFQEIRNSKLPETYPTKETHDYDDRDRKLRAHLIGSFKELSTALTVMFSGGDPNGFLPVMGRVGAAIQTCWRSGVLPRFS